MTLAVGQLAPDSDVLRADGSAIALATLWQQRAVVLTFLRHFGCNFCRAFLSELRHAYPDIINHRAAVVGVAHGTPGQVAHFGRSLRLPFPLLADPDRHAYRAYELRDATWGELVHPQVGRHIAQTTLSGHPIGLRAHIDGLLGRGVSLQQLGGTFVIDRGGVVVYGHESSPIYRTPAIADLLAVLELTAT